MKQKSPYPDISSFPNPLRDRLRNRLPSYPTVWDYAKLLHIVCSVSGMDKETARNKYGLFSYREWMDELQTKTNNNETEIYNH